MPQPQSAASRTVRVSIDRPAAEVYAFASDPQNFPLWVTSFCSGVRQLGGGWVMDTPGGPVGIRFEPANDRGVLDHTVTLPDGREILNPMRVVPAASGCEVTFVLARQDGMSDEQFEADARMVEADLAMLKRVLQG